MEFILKNSKNDLLKVYIEPSTDELTLKKNDMLKVSSKLADQQPFEIHHHNDSIVIWIPHGQSANFFINGQEIETMCSRFVW
jgi:hypothetical protein